MMKGATVNPKSLVMLDATGKMAALKLTTSTGLHVYDGSMLWVNPAATVTAAAPTNQQQAAAPVIGPKVTKALAIVHPDTGEELVVKKQEAPPEPTESTPSSTAPQQPVQPPSATFTSPAPTQTPTPSAPQKETNIIDLLAKATKKSPQDLLSLSQQPMPPLPGRGRGRDYDDYDRDQGRQKGRGKGAEGKGKGRATRPATNDQPIRKKGDYSGEKYTKDAKYTASLDGRFWSLSVWPKGVRDEEHRLAFGKHKLDVLENGAVKVVLFGGVNRYKIRLHLCTEDDEFGNNDKEGWGLASCEPNAANLQLTDEAEKLGWAIHKVGDHPLICPPGLTPEGAEGKVGEEKATDAVDKADAGKSTGDGEVAKEQS